MKKGNFFYINKNKRKKTRIKLVAGPGFEPGTFGL
jgi:hypothetical protein